MGIEPLWRQRRGPAYGGPEPGNDDGILLHDVVSVPNENQAFCCRASFQEWLERLHTRFAGALPREGDALAWGATSFWSGIMAWFAWPSVLGQAGGVTLLTVALCVMLLRAWALRQPYSPVMERLLRPLWLPALMLAGLGWMSLHAAKIETVLLPANVGMVQFEGRVLQTWMAGPRKARLLVQVHALPAVAAAFRPQKIRLTLRLPKAPEGLASRWQRLPLPGDRVKGRMRLRRLPMPVAPDAHDPRRALWFAGVGATAFAHYSWLVSDRGQGQWVEGDDCADCTFSIALERGLERLRRKVALALEKVIEDPHAASLAMALITGARGVLTEDDQMALRASGLSHILAISGLHLALVAGAVFWIVRAVLAAFPTIALTWPVRRIAALAALVAALAYMLLSGNSVATQRAFIMLMVATLALMLDRPAITMRTLGLAAFMILIMRPEAAVTAGFQMSFAAVMALIATWELLRNLLAERGRGVSVNGLSDRRAFHWLQRAMKGTGALVLSTFVAGLATLLPALWHFQQTAPWSLAGNLVALPLLSFVVMPLGLAGLAGMPLGLQWMPWQGMQTGLEVMLDWARMVSSWPGAYISMPALPLSAALMATTGLLWLVLRRDAWRLLGLPLAGLMLCWSVPKQADVLVDAHARLVAARDTEGKLVPLALAGSGRGYVLRMWLRRDGDETSPTDALKRFGWKCKERLCRFERLDGRRIWALRRNARKGDDVSEKEQALTARNMGSCAFLARGDVFVSAEPLHGACRQRGAVIIDRFDVWRLGAFSLTAYPKGKGWQVRTTADVATRGPWAQPPRSRRAVIDSSWKHEPEKAIVSERERGKVDPH